MDKKSFTLIELLVLVFILAILVLLISPQFKAIRADANKKICLANLRGLISAMAIYEVKEKNTAIKWSEFSPEDLVKWGYLFEEPFCPYDVNKQRPYRLMPGVKTSDLNIAVCPYADTYLDHVWP
ncbi:MAG: prepilin-type N-terminal cleavage/methylation domain-containing protein [Candidatus Omnitrophota bacterium]